MVGAGISGIGAAIRLARGRRRRRGAAGGRRRLRRHLAGEHLSRVRLRRAVAALLLLVRPEPFLDADVRDPAGDPRLRPPHRRCPRPAGPDPVRGPHGGRSLGRRGRRVGARRRARARWPAASWWPRPDRGTSRTSPRSPASTLSRARSSTPHGGTTTSTCAAVGSPSSAPAPPRCSSCPEIQPDVARLHLFQRTAQWVLPKPDHAIPGLQRWALGAVPGLRAGQPRPWSTARWSSSGSRCATPAGWGSCRPSARRTSGPSCVTPTCGRRSRPDYLLGCKRLLFSNTYLQSLTRAERRGARLSR